jgi:serine/threonine protein kinase
MNAESKLEAAVCYVAANVRDPQLRAQFLDQACAGDPELRAAVEEMLRHHGAAESFFADGRAAVNSPDADAQAAAMIKETNGNILLDGFADEQIGQQVGRYKLLQKIGEGGCGVVYLAEQAEPVRRQVALKVIKLGMDTKNVIRRFEAERQALAMMDHPNIARVLDAGATETGRPFFVMELVRGARITKFCDENHFDTRQRLALFIQVCRAIQHAHQKGVIHRDIKPSNILVTLHDGAPVPKVIDFGIAKATEGSLTDNTLFTAVEQFVGTPVYMSPEQAEAGGLDIDTRSDIYSLGILLYELLTGRTPFDTTLLMQSGWEQMRRTLREKEPPIPSTMITSLRPTELTLAASRRQAEPLKLISQIKGDLDWIVMKAIEKERNCRYETANGLAMEIQRFLDNEPVMARPPNRLYRFQKLVKRNKVVFVAGTVVALALLLGLGFSTWFFFREREARQRETQLRAQAEDRAKVTQAVMLINQGKYEDADAILNETEMTSANPTLDRVLALRSLGEWLALHGHWQPAAQRFAALLKVNQVDSLNQIALDYQACAVALVEAGDLDEYRQLRGLILTNCSAMTNSSAGGSFLISGLELPLDKLEITALTPLAELMKTQLAYLPKNKQSEWTFMPLALWSYRCGDYETAIRLSQRALAQGNNFPACEASVRAILALALAQAGQNDRACEELGHARQLIDGKFKGSLEHGRSGAGFWFDWIYARHLVKEADVSANCDPSPAATK